MTHPISRVLTARTEILAAMARCRPDDLVRLAEMVRAYEAMPEAWDEVLRCFPVDLLAEVAAVLREGGERHGVGPLETGGGQTLFDHVHHALGHVENIRVVGGDWMDAAGNVLAEQVPYRVPPEDVEDITHAIARLTLAWIARGK